MCVLIEVYISGRPWPTAGSYRLVVVLNGAIFCMYVQGLSIQRDRKHCINFVDNKIYLVDTVPYLQTL